MEGLGRLPKGQIKKAGVGRADMRGVGLGKADIRKTDISKAGNFMQLLRLALIIFMLGAMLFVVFESGQTTYLITQVFLLFCALFFGYRFGPGAGAIAGSISGIVLSLVSGEAAQIGILCLLGIFSGAFRRLGKMASVTAYAAAAFGVGILYSPALLFQTMESVLAVGAVFLLLPDKLILPE